MFDGDEARTLHAGCSRSAEFALPSYAGASCSRHFLDFSPFRVHLAGSIIGHLAGPLRLTGAQVSDTYQKSKTSAALRSRAAPLTYIALERTFDD